MKINDILLGAAELLQNYCQNEDCCTCYFIKEDGRCRIGFYNRYNEPKTPYEWELEGLKNNAD